MDDWGDLTPGALSYTEPAVENVFQPVMSGPQPAGDPTAPPNRTPGDIILPRGASIQLSGGGAIKNNGRASDFEISEDVGLLAKGVGVNLASLISSAYESAPVQWFSEVSFAEVAVTAPYPASPTDHFYSDAFKQNVTGDLTVTDVVDNGDSWTVTFSGAALTADYQAGNLIEPDWVAPWFTYLSILANGTDWVEIDKAGLSGYPPVVTDTFSIHGVYANTIMTWQQAYALWFTVGSNAGDSSSLDTAVGHTVDRATGLVHLNSAQANNIEAGDRLKAYDLRVLFEYGWNNSRVILAPSERCPDDLDMYLGAGGTHPGTQFNVIYLRAKNGIYLCPAYGTSDKIVHVASATPQHRAHLQVDKGNVVLSEGYIAMEALPQPAAVADNYLIHLDDAYNYAKITYPDGQVKNILTQDAAAENGCEIIAYP